MSARAAWLVLVALLGAYFAPVWLRGEVIFAHDNARELSTGPIESDRLSTRYFSDQSSAYLPEVEVQLHGARSGWISTWNPHVELGRPTGQLSGLGKAFLPMHALSFVTDDALRVTTWLTVLAVCAAGLFGMAFLRALGLAPAASLTGAIGLSLGVYTTFWLTFPMFVWGIAWTLAILWLTVGFVERPGPARWLGIAFCTNALLLSAYPQQVVWHAYALIGFALVRVARGRAAAGAGRGLGARLGLLLWLGAAALVGALAALPVFLDLALDSARSGRDALAPSFYLASIPRIGDAADLWLAWARTVDPFLWGNPLAEDAPFDVNQFKGAAWTPFFAGLAACSLLAPVRRRAWGWQLAVAWALFLTFCPAAFLLAVRFSGLSLSRFPPLAGVWIPFMVVAAYAADGLLRELRAARGGLARAALGAAPGLAALACAAALEPPLDARSAAFSAALVLGTALCAWRPRPALLGVLALATALGYGWRLRLVRPVDSIRLDSPLCERLRELTGDGSRYALTGFRVRVLPPNQEALHGLRSIHTYDPIASRGYRDWVDTISEQGMRLDHWGGWDELEDEARDEREADEGGAYGRQFRRVVPARGLVDPMLSFSGVGVLISDGTHDPRVAPPGNGVLRTNRAPLLEAQLTEFEALEDGVRVPGVLHDAPHARCERVLDLGDRLRFEVTPSAAPSLLFVSQQHHPRWRAQDQAGRALETTVVNGVWLGVRLPPDTSAVELAFEPHVRRAWIPEVLFLAAGALCAARAGLSALRGAARARGTR